MKGGEAIEEGTAVGDDSLSEQGSSSGDRSSGEKWLSSDIF